MKANLSNYRITLLGTMFLIATIALFIKFSMWAIWPAYLILIKCERYIDEEMGEDVKPFWPCYWRMLRNIPEPYDLDEMRRPDDGGLLLMGAIALTVFILLTYKFRKYLVRRI